MCFFLWYSNIFIPIGNICKMDFQPTQSFERLLLYISISISIRCHFVWRKKSVLIVVTVQGKREKKQHLFLFQCHCHKRKLKLVKFCRYFLLNAHSFRICIICSLCVLECFLQYFFSLLFFWKLLFIFRWLSILD